MDSETDTPTEPLQPHPDAPVLKGVPPPPPDVSHLKVA